MELLSRGDGHVSTKSDFVRTSRSPLRKLLPTLKSRSIREGNRTYKWSCWVEGMGMCQGNPGKLSKSRIWVRRSTNWRKVLGRWIFICNWILKSEIWTVKLISKWIWNRKIDFEIKFKSHSSWWSYRSISSTTSFPRWLPSSSLSTGFRRHRRRFGRTETGMTECTLLYIACI